MKELNPGDKICLKDFETKERICVKCVEDSSYNIGCRDCYFCHKDCDYPELRSTHCGTFTRSDNKNIHFELVDATDEKKSQTPSSKSNTELLEMNKGLLKSNIKSFLSIQFGITIDESMEYYIDMLIEQTRIGLEY